MRYEILRDVLIIVVTAAAVLSALIGGLVFFVLRSILIKDVSSEVNQKVDSECRKLNGLSDIQLGVTYWIQKSYDNAIKVTERAIFQAQDVLSEDRLIFAKSNLGFYYAEKHKYALKQKQKPFWHWKQKAIELTKVGFDRYSASTPDLQAPDWIDNYVFVRVVFAQTDSEKAEIIQLIDELLPRGDLEAVRRYLEQSKEYISKN